MIPDPVRRRLAPPALPAGSGWVVTAIVVAVAAILRLDDLAHPAGIQFDEVYYANEARAMLEHGVEYKDGNPAFVVHPPLGKWLIAMGIRLFGFTEVGWRVAAAVAGTLCVLIIVRTGRRLFRSDVLAGAAGLLVALDGMHLVMSRVALLDIFLTLFVVAAFGCLVLDRERRRARWLAALEAGRGGPAFAVPWWRLAAGVLIGCGLAVKWSALWYLLAFLLLIYLWEVGARRSAGAPRAWRGALVGESGWLAAVVVLAVIVYVASWAGWFAGDTGYFRHWLRDSSGVDDGNLVGVLTNWWHYHREAYGFHTGLSKQHTYQSWPWQWLLLGRPVLIYRSAAPSCGAPSCMADITALGTPLLWWAFPPVLAVLARLGISRRDWRVGALFICVGAGLLPWFWYALQGRTMFAFYALPALPFLALATAYVLGVIAKARPGFLGPAIAGAYMLLVVACFAYFYPIYMGHSLPYDAWQARMWLGGRWI